MATVHPKFDKEAPQMIADLINDFKFLQPFQASAFPGQAAQESAWLTDLVEDTGTGRGYFQWSFSRRKDFENWLKRRGFALDSYLGNYSYLYRELVGPEKRVLTLLRNAKTVEEATRFVMDVFERPTKSTANLARRIEGAKRALALYEDNPPHPTIWPTDKPAPVTPPVTPPVVVPPVVEPKPEWKSTTVQGAIIAIVTPFISLAIQKLASIPPETLGSYITQALAVFGPMIGGGMAYVGRRKATQPIANTQAADDVEDALLEVHANATVDNRLREPVPETEQETIESSRATGLMGLSIEEALVQVPILAAALEQLSDMTKQFRPATSSSSSMPETKALSELLAAHHPTEPERKQ